MPKRPTASIAGTSIAASIAADAGGATDLAWDMAENVTPPLITKVPRAALGRLGSNELNELDLRAHKEEKFGELVRASNAGTRAEPVEPC